MREKEKNNTPWCTSSVKFIYIFFNNTTHRGDQVLLILNPFFFFFFVENIFQDLFRGTKSESNTKDVFFFSVTVAEFLIRNLTLSRHHIKQVECNNNKKKSTRHCTWCELENSARLYWFSSPENSRWVSAAEQHLTSYGHYLIIILDSYNLRKNMHYIWLAAAGYISNL